MADRTKYRIATDLPNEKTNHGYDSSIPPLVNFLAATNHIRNLFENKKILYGMTGGFETLCLGYRREMLDLHIAYDDKDFFRIKKKLQADKRVVISDGMNPLFPFKILVCTGPAYKDLGCHKAAAIEVNMIPPESCGSPPSGVLSNSLVLVSLKKDGQLKTYNGLNMLYLLQTMLHLCESRNLAWDPRKDILFLCRIYGSEVQAIRAKLDEKLVERNFLGTPFLSRLSREDQHNCYQVLLGKESPPLMSISPPTPQVDHGRSVSDPAIRTLGLNQHHYMPELGIRKSLDVLTPTLPAMAKSPRKDSLVAGLESPGAVIAAKPTTLGKPAPKRHSRLRYRSTRNTQVKPGHGKDQRSPQSLEQHIPTQQTQPEKASCNGIPIMVLSERSETSESSLPAEAQAVPNLFHPFEGPSTCSEQDAEPQQHPQTLQTVVYKGLRDKRPVPGVTSDASATSPDSAAKRFELTTTSHIQETIAELSAEIEAALQFATHEMPDYQYSSEDHSDQNLTQQQLRANRCSKECEPLNDLPVTLMAGWGKRVSSDIKAMSGETMRQPVLGFTGGVKTNASRYSRYYPKPVSAPNSNTTSTQLTPVTSTVYKAYHPESLPSVLQNFDSASADRQAISLEEHADFESARDWLRTHKGERNHESTEVHISQNSSSLAQAYQAELPDFGDGYGTGTCRDETEY
ncbi:hypothetical protein IAQ61_003573 [Plenodomus lingam]|uniref:uncharacterized protein n=1 Tax=Leptosphaeria maculans TaxID=5022 RepID=UPI00332A8F46|nr:hypothetical protein IAQ61_003573 [Plenodomus lingam]